MSAESPGDQPRRVAEDTPTLLAVDLGVRTGLALFGRDGRLRRRR